jgi:hypothetical protein
MSPIAPFAHHRGRSHRTAQSWSGRFSCAAPTAHRVCFLRCFGRVTGASRSFSHHEVTGRLSRIVRIPPRLGRMPGKTKRTDRAAPAVDRVRGVAHPHDAPVADIERPVGVERRLLTGIRRARRDGRRLRLPALRERRPRDDRGQGEGAGRRRSPSLPGCRGQATLFRASTRGTHGRNSWRTSLTSRPPCRCQRSLAT